ncbi:phage terminase large subunit family protein [Rhizobium sp. LjRoot98]|uniref:terminase gpA endonuclease subunit n=1 Tax=Rhizobium sp. LjRoot98 TaxID=3342345 RepID=UPI003ECF4F1E
MPLDLVQNREEARAALDAYDFSIGFDELRASVEELKNEFLQIPVFVDPVDWAYVNIALSASETSRPGPFRPSVYQREMMRLVTSTAVRQITILKGVQIGYSKTLKIIFAYVVAYMAKRVAVVFPTQRDVKRFYKDEIADMYQSVPELSKITRELERGVSQDTWNEQRFINSAIAYFRAAFNEDDLQSFTAWLMMADEVDRSGWQPKKDSAGNKLEQLRNRGVDLVGSKLIVGSTPGVRHISVIWQQWLTSDQSKLYVKCPHCQAEQELIWGSDKTVNGFAWDLDDNGRVSAGYYRCISSTKEQVCRIEEIDKEEMIDAGIFKATTVAKVPGNVGLHVPSWLSMSPGATWKVLAQKWLNAQGDVEKLKEFVMFNMAEPWDEFDSRSFVGERLADKTRSYPAEVPDDVVVLLLGGDDQTNKEGDAVFKLASREISVVGLNRRKEPRLILHKIIPGEVGEETADAIYRHYVDRPYHKRDGSKWFVQAGAMDMGGHHGDQTMIFAASFPPKNAMFAIRGASPAEGTRLPSLWPKDIGTAVRKKRKLYFYTVDTQAARDRAAEKLVLSGSHAPIFPSSVPDDYFEKVTSEHQVKQKNGGYHWEPKKGRRSEEEWVTIAYAYAAYEGLCRKRPQWRDLNLAAKKLGVPDIAVDEETDELMWEYDGADQSVMAKEAPDEFPQIEQHVFRTVKVEGSHPLKERKVNHAPVQPMAAAQAGGEQTRKRRRGGIIR